MSGQWKPGDVATSDHAGISVVVPKCDKHFARGPHWHHMSGGWDSLNDALSVGRFRPLVVIDPEDREQVERLADANERATPDGLVTPTQSTDAMQAALRSLIAPPKPPEPQGLGAVVEDAAGDYWVYAGLRSLKDGETRIWVHANQTQLFADIDAVKVLSEGVTP